MFKVGSSLRNPLLQLAARVQSSRGVADRGAGPVTEWTLRSELRAAIGWRTRQLDRPWSSECGLRARRAAVGALAALLAVLVLAAAAPPPVAAAPSIERATSAAASEDAAPGGVRSPVRLLEAVSAVPRSATAPSVERTAQSTSTYRILLLIFRETDTDYVDASGATRHLTTELPRSDIEAMLQSLGPLSTCVRQWSNNQVAWDVEVRYPSEPVNRVSTPHPSDAGRRQWLSPDCITEAIQQYHRPGYHDNIFVYWRNGDDLGGQIPAGGAWGLASSWRSSGYVTVTYLGWTIWKPWAVDGDAGVWLHEWIHNVAAFYSGLGYRMPVKDADGAVDHGYTFDQPPYPGWSTYYADLMNNRVLEDGAYTGIPAEAWARATIADSVDEAPPVTTQSGAGAVWHNAPVTVSLTAVDEGSPASGVWATSFKLDDGEWTTGTSVTLPAPGDHSGDGLHRVSYRSVDAVGNRERDRSIQVNIDTLGPSTRTRSASGRVRRPLTLRFRVDDALSPHATAVTLVVRNAQGQVVRRWTVPGDLTTGAWLSRVWTPKARGHYRYSVTASDLAGNAAVVVASAQVAVR